MKNILITGITGFAGSHLAELLVNTGNVHITGTFLAEKSLKNVSAIEKKLDLVRIDLTHQHDVNALITTKKLDEIYHLAASSSVRNSFVNPSETFHNNIDAEIFLLESVRKQNLTKTKLLLVSSAEVYGYVKKEDLPIDEETPLRPANPYAVSKIAQDFLGLQYFLSYRQPIIRVRPFPHIGSRQTKGFVIADFASQIALIEKGKQKPVISVGNLEAKRDFTDVRDMVKAYALLMERGQTGDVYNIGSGKQYAIQDVLDMLLAMSTVKITVAQDPSLLRPSDNPELVCDPSKMKKLTEWKTTIPLKKSLQDVLAYWRKQ
ncbi:MAG TPA: GDP-mannose 4,6-dehydratase [Patescibacteria group bacterium]|nr:GDP-mannose 4,6-dehydratase [Patescibacteria group bacterium]